MKKIYTILIIVSVFIGFTFSTISSNASSGMNYKELDTSNTIQINADGFKDIDYLKGASTSDSQLDLKTNLQGPRYPGDILSDSYYVSVGARTSVRIGVYLSEFTYDAFNIEWDGATQYNPQMDIVFEDVETGYQFSCYDNLGYLISANAGNLKFDIDKPGYFRIWFRSIGYSDVTFYRVTVKDAWE